MLARLAFSKGLRVLSDLRTCEGKSDRSFWMLAEKIWYEFGVGVAH